MDIKQTKENIIAIYKALGIFSIEAFWEIENSFTEDSEIIVFKNIKNDNRIVTDGTNYLSISKPCYIKQNDYFKYVDRLLHEKTNSIQDVYVEELLKAAFPRLAIREIEKNLFTGDKENLESLGFESLIKEEGPKIYGANAGEVAEHTLGEDRLDSTDIAEDHVPTIDKIMMLLETLEAIAENEDDYYMTIDELQIEIEQMLKTLKLYE
jgi:hypothetical protein